jgi:ABC-type polysaccharide/polyol phosphate export permease
MAAELDPAPASGTAFSARNSLFRDAWREAVETYRFRPLIRALVSTSLRTENIGTLLGYLWWLIDPLLLVLSFYLLVGIAFRQGGTDVALFISISVVAWKFFAAGTRNALVSTAAKERQMRHVRFPRVVFPISSLIAESVRFAFGLVVLIVAIAIVETGIDITLPFVLVIILIQFIFALGVAFFLAALNIFFRDVQHLTLHAFQAWFIVSPGLYEASVIPERYQSIYELNPFATILPAYHSLLLDHAISNPVGLAKVGAASVFMLLFGYLFFVRLEPSFAKVS